MSRKKLPCHASCRAAREGAEGKSVSLVANKKTVLSSARKKTVLNSEPNKTVLNDEPNKTVWPGARLSRREAHGVFGASLGFLFIPSRVWGQIERPTLAGIGTGGKGRTDIREAAAAGFSVAALVDVVDARRITSTSRRLGSVVQTRGDHPNAPFFGDYREMFDQMGDRIDAVTISTPDHHHFHAAAIAINSGKHVYCQKPLTHSIWEARQLTTMAKKSNEIRTQMGNQAHAGNSLRRCVELVRGGLIGKVREVHAWTNRPIWAQGFSSRPQAEALPVGLNWDQWIGPAPFTPYSAKLAPFAWRGWWDYGTGALGDMACHILDMPYWALEPGMPRFVTAHPHGGTELSPPIRSKIVWEFGPSPFTSSDGVKFHWYEGLRDANFDPERWALVKLSEDYHRPDDDVLEGLDYRKFGCVVVGEHGKLYFQRRRGEWVLRTSRAIDGFDWPEPTLPRAPRENNYQEWFDAVTGKLNRGASDFALAGPLTETVLLGVLAQRVPDTRLQWDAQNLRVVNRPDLSEWIQRPYRTGWEFEA